MLSGALIAVLLLFACGGFTLAWKRFAAVFVPLQKADAIIVLGGDSMARPKEAASLYRAGVAPRVYVTGEGDSARSRNRLIELGVPAGSIQLEGKALTTYTNATMLKPMLAADGVRRAVLVTSPFHTRRALSTFRHVMPRISFGVVGAENLRWSRGKQDWLALLEIVKILEYRMLYGVPVLLPGNRSLPDKTGE